MRAAPVAPIPWEAGMEAQYPGSKLCTKCQGLIQCIQKHVDVRAYSYHKTIDAARRGVEHDNCALCYQFWRATGPDMQQSLRSYQDWTTWAIACDPREENSHDIR